MTNGRDRYRADRDPECTKSCKECRANASATPCFKCVDKVLNVGKKSKPETEAAAKIIEQATVLQQGVGGVVTAKEASEFLDGIEPSVDYKYRPVEPTDAVLESVLEEGSRRTYPNESGRYLRYDLLPFDVLKEITEVFAFGQEKHVERAQGEGRSWTAGKPYSHRVNKMLRHLTAFIGGNTRDEESGRHHLAHMIVQAMMLLGMEIRGYQDQDDRSRLNGKGGRD